MDSQLFYLLNLVFAVAFLLWFFGGRRTGGRSPTPLKMREDKTRDQAVRSVLQAEPEKSEFRDVTHTKTTAETVLSSKDRKMASRRVLFMYNGHDWDAHEVLGVGLAATLPEITDRYQQLLKSSDPSQMDFLECAYQSLLKALF